MWALLPAVLKTPQVIIALITNLPAIIVAAKDFFKKEKKCEKKD